MENIVRKAIEGGWNDGFGGGYSEYGFWQVIVCDPLFWQALGKACVHKGEEINNHTDWSHKDAWKHYALRFHEINLTESWEKAIEYLETLIKQ